MLKRRHALWGPFLLVCAAGIALLDGPAMPAASDDPHTGYVPVIFSSPFFIYLPAISHNWPPYPYSLHPGSPIYLANFLNTAGCNWFGIAGLVFGPEGNPVMNLTVHLEGGGISADTVTGSGQ